MTASSETFVPRARPEEALAGAATYLLLPASLAAVVVVSLAAYYVSLTVQLPEGTEWLFFVLVAVIAVLAISAMELRGRRHLRAVRRLASGTLRPTSEHLAAAAVAAFALPDRIFFFTLQHWIAGGVSIGLSYRLLAAGVAWSMVGRCLAVAILFGLLTALLSQVLVTRRARRMLLRLRDCGLGADELAQALPSRRVQIRGRLLVFTGIAVLVPVALNVDVSAALAQSGFEEMVDLQDPAQFEAAARALRNRIYLSVGVLCALVVAVAIAAAWIVGDSLGGPLQEIAEEAVRIADGQLASSRLVPAEDEVWAVSTAFTAMQAHMRNVVSQLKQAGQHIGDTANEIVGTSTRHEAGAAEQAAALNQTSATTEELARSARQIADNAGSVAGLAQRTLEAAQGGQHSADAFSQSMARMQEDNRAIAEAVVKLNKRVQQIGKIVAFINGVADKSDLLALNAELEGTKAGEVGRGFSLVAGEMRRLAENVIESTQEIEGLIEEIREATTAAVNATQTGVAATTEGSHLATELGQHLQEIVRLAGQTSDAVRAISLATQQQQSGTDQLAEAMADILRVTQESLAANRQVSAANVDLTALARELKQAVDRFEVA